MRVAVSVAPDIQVLNTTGETEYWQPPTSPNCLTVKRRSASVMVPTRSGIWVERVTAYETVPGPDPCVAPLTASHDASLAAVHGHSAGAVTEKLPEPPSLPNSALPGVMS